MARRTPRSRTAPLLAAAWLAALAPALAAQTYWPGTHLDWERRTPQEAGFDGERLQAAIDKTLANPANHTGDLGGKADTKTFTDAVIANLDGPGAR